MSLPPDLVERAFTRADGPSLIALIADCDATYLDWAPPGWSPPEVASDWPDRFLEPGLWARVAVDPAGRIAGAIAFRRETDATAHVGILLVAPARWREGIAAVLLARSEAEMRAQGYARAQLWTPAGAPAEQFYAARGWERDGRRDWNPWLGLPMVGYAKSLA